jgi:hypothetical protein
MGYRRQAGHIRSWAGPSPPGFKLGTTLLVIGLSSALATQDAAAQTTILGVVRDSASTEALPNAYVSMDEGAFRTLTDEFGKFSFVNVASGTHVLRVEILGYEPVEITVNPAEIVGTVLSISMRVEAIEVAGVTVRSRQQTVDVTEDVSEVSISPEAIKMLPSVGETDLFRSMQLLPGVSGTNDASSGLFVRGGTPDENLVLLDGMTVYHVDHLFGVFSAFNADAIKDMRLFKGAFPAKYGGRTSSVVELVGKSGDMGGFRASGGLNLLSGRGVFEVPFLNKGSFLVSARRSFTDLIQSSLYNNIFGALQGADETSTQGGLGFGRRGRFGQAQITPTVYFYDFNAKATYSPTDRDVLAVSYYSGRDNLDQSSASSPFTGPGGSTFQTPDRSNLSEWGNQGVSARWARHWGAFLSTDLLVATSRYFSDADNTVTGNGIEQGFREENEVQDLTFRADNTLQLPWRGALEFGIQHTQSEVNYDFVRNLSDTVSGTLGISGAADLTAGYASHQWQPTSDWDLTVGVRATKFEGTGEVYWDPRASLEYSLTDHISLKGALGLHHQFVKRIENEDILEGSRDFWVLADSVLPPGSAEHRIAGLSWENDDFLIDLEAYDKDLGGVSQFSTRYRARPDQEFEELFFSGTGFARGIEVLAQKKRGDLTGWISYTLGEVKYDLDGFNNDQPFSASQDQRHEFKAVGTYRLGRWTLASTWVFGSGTPYTLPESQYVLTLLDGTEMTYIHVGEKNGDRLPAYHRLDLAATWSFQNEIFSGDLSFSVFNAYGHDNIWYRQFDLSQTPMLLTDVTTLPFTPSLGVSLFFN